MANEINLVDLFSAATDALQSNRKKLNKADGLNGDHGDNMVQIFELITGAVDEKKAKDLPTQLKYAAQVLGQKTSSGSAAVYTQGLNKAAKQVKGADLSLDTALEILQTIMNGGKKKSSSGADLIGQLLAGFGGSKKKKKAAKDETDWISVGLGLLQGAQDAGIDLGGLAKSLVSKSEMGKSEHRTQSGEIVTSTVLETLLASFKS